MVCDTVCVYAVQPNRNDFTKYLSCDLCVCVSVCVNFPKVDCIIHTCVESKNTYIN